MKLSFFQVLIVCGLMSWNTCGFGQDESAGQVSVLVPATHEDATPDATQRTPLKVLLVAGGCCHDYQTQTQLLKTGIEARIHAEVTVEFNPEGTQDTRFKIYEADNWAEGFDVVIHDECSANVIEQPYVQRILAAHRNGVPAVNLHCAMHSYRWGDYRNPVPDGAENFAWYEMIGVQSCAHGPQAPIDVSYVKDSGPITNGLEDWQTINEELYNNVRVHSTTQALATGQQLQEPSARQKKENPEATPITATAVVVWTNLYGPNKTRIFSTSLGHNNETVDDGRYLDLVVRGLLWATDNLTAEGKPVPNYVK